MQFKVILHFAKDDRAFKGDVQSIEIRDENGVPVFEPMSESHLGAFCAGAMFAFARHGEDCSSEQIHAATGRTLGEEPFDWGSPELLPPRIPLRRG